ncbi:MAG: alkaline phosphatase family protein [Candidatus Thorarchaeota archaeon]
MVRNSKINQVILIILDDVRAEHLYKLINEGKLPNMRNLVENGISCSNCVTSYPAITFPCYGNIVTGSYSGYFPKEGNALPLYHWLNRKDPPSTSKKPPFIRNYGDRSQLLKANKDIGKNVKTIFEQIPEGNILSSSCFLFRGAYFVVGKSVYDVEAIFKHLIEAFEHPKTYFPNKEVPILSVGYVFQTDDLMHELGFDHPNYINLIVECDRYLGSLMNSLKKTGYYDSTAIGLISDHGNFKAKKIVDLEPFFQEKGLIPYNPEKGTGDFDCNIGSMGFFNFPGDTWQHHPSIQQMQKFKVSEKGKQEMNLFNTLWEIPGVKYMYYREDYHKPEKGIIHIEYLDENSGKKRHGMIEYRGFGKDQQAKYTFEGNDFYQYSDNEKSAKILDNKFHTLEEWLEATNHINFPMIIDQIPRYFKNPRSCDIIISTLGEYGFNYDHGVTQSASPYIHDIGLRKCMIVPFIIGGSSELPQKDLKYCKTTDMVPTLLELLGIKPHSSVIGKSVFKYP